MTPLRWFFLLSLCFPSLYSQTYSIATVAGTTRVKEGAAAKSTPLRSADAIDADRAGNVYVVDTVDNRVLKLSPDGTVTTLAGPTSGFGGDGGPGYKAALNGIYSIAADANGTVYVADNGNARVRKVDAAGTITTIAGNGEVVALQSEPDGILGRGSTVLPTAVAVDGKGNVYVADFAGMLTVENFQYKLVFRSRIRMIDSAGVIRTVAGGEEGYVDNVPVADARFGMIYALAVDGAGNIYAADHENHRVRKVVPGGTVTSIAGTASSLYNGDNIPGAQAGMDPEGLALDADGNVYVADYLNDRVRRIAAKDGMVTTIAGDGHTALQGDGGPARIASVGGPAGVARTADGRFFIAERDNRRVRQIAADGTISSIAGTKTGDGGPSLEAFLDGPRGAFVDAGGNIIVADAGNNSVRRIAVVGDIELLAGTGYPGYTSGGPAVSAMLNAPGAVSGDAAGNVYIADTGNSRVRRIAPNGTISTVAGTGDTGSTGDGGAATAAQIGKPSSLAVDGAGNLYIGDTKNYRIRKVTPGGVISTFAGKGSSPSSGDGGPATSAGLVPSGMAFDRTGNLFVADRTNHMVRKIDTSGNISTVAGTGAEEYSGDGGPAVKAALHAPSSVAPDGTGGFFIADFDNEVVRRVAPDGNISTIAGTKGKWQISGDGGPALGAQLDPIAVAWDGKGNLIVVDYMNDRVRRISPQVPSAAIAGGGGGQTVLVGQQAAQPLTVVVTDSNGVPIAGVTVKFAVTSGTATLSPAQQTTGADGKASTTVQAGAAGDVVVTATPTGLAPVTFRLTAVAANTPRISKGGIVSAGLSIPLVRALAPNALITVFGENFAPAGTFRQVGADDLTGGELPVRFAGVCVLVNNVQAPVYAVLPQQISFQAPALPASGSVEVRVARNCGAADEVKSEAESVPVQAAAPEFFHFVQNADGRNPVAAIDSLSGSYIGREALLPGATFAPAKPGQILTLFLTGLGATDPAFRAGVFPDRAGKVLGEVVVKVGDVTVSAADLLYAGVAPFYAGLYQVNVRVPAGTADGDQPVSVSVGGASTPPGAYITVRQ